MRGIKPDGTEDFMLFSELKCKEVINLRDCRKLGRIEDFEFDVCTGCICKVIVPGGTKWKRFFNCEDVYKRQGRRAQPYGSRHRC